MKAVLMSLGFALHEPNGIDEKTFPSSCPITQRDSLKWLKSPTTTRLPKTMTSRTCLDQTAEFQSYNGGAAVQASIHSRRRRVASDHSSGWFSTVAGRLRKLLS